MSPPGAPRARTGVLGLVVAAAALALTACAPSPEGPVTVGTDVWPGFEPGYIAERGGLYGKADVNLIQLRSATEVQRAFRNRVIDVAAVTLDEALLLRQSGVPVQVILVADVSDGADAILARPPIEDVRGLAGRRVGVEDSALGEYVLQRALETGGVESASVTRVPITVDQSLAVYREGQVDAVVTFEPFKTQVAQAGGRTIFDSRRIPGEIVDVLVVRTDFAASHPQALNAVVTGWLSGSRRLAERRPDELREVGRRLGLAPAQLEAALSTIRLADRADNVRLLAQDGPVSRAARRLAPMLQARSGAPVDADPSRLLTTRFLPRAGVR